GVVDEEVDPAAGGLHERHAVLGVRDVAAHRRHPGQPARGASELGTVARVDDNVPAPLGQAAGQGEAEAARGTGDDRGRAHVTPFARVLKVLPQYKFKLT